MPTLQPRPFEGVGGTEGAELSFERTIAHQRYHRLDRCMALQPTDQPKQQQGRPSPLTLMTDEQGFDHGQAPRALSPIGGLSLTQVPLSGSPGVIQRLSFHIHRPLVPGAAAGGAIGEGPVFGRLQRSCL